MQLRKTETLRIFDHHNAGVRYIHTNFDHRRRNKNLDFIFHKSFHDLVLLGRFHLAMEIRNRNILWQCTSQFFCIRNHIFCFDLLALLHHRTDDIRLMPHFYLFFYKTICFRTVRGVNHTVFDRQTVCRKFIHNRNIKISIQDHGQCSWDRSCTHNHHMRHISFFRQRLSLPHTETVLLIGNHKCQIFILDLFLKDRMRPDDDL